MAGGDAGTTTTKPWEGQQPYLSDIMSQAAGQYRGAAPQYYPGSTTVGFSPQTEQSFDMTTARAMGGAPYENAFSNYLTNSLSQGLPDVSGAMNMANQGVGGMTQGMNLISQGATNPFSNPFDARNFMMANSAGGPVGNMDPSQGYVANTLGGSPTASLAPTTQYIQDVLSQSPSLDQTMSTVNSAMDPAAQSQLSSTASGGYLGGNPFLDQLFNSASSKLTENFNENVLPGIDARFGAAGRSNSGAQALFTGKATGDLNDSIASMAADIYAPAYESERNRMVDAAGTLGNYNLGSTGLAADIYGGEQQRRLGAAGLGTDAYATEQNVMGNAANLGADMYGMENQVNLGLGGLSLDTNRSAGDLYNTGNQMLLQGGGLMGDLGLGSAGVMSDIYGNIDNSQFRAGSLVPSAQQVDYTNAGMMGQIGAQIEDQGQRYLDDAVNRFNYNENLPYDQLQRYMQAVYGIPGGYGTTQTTPSRGSRVAGAAGGAMAGYQMTGNPYGAIFGGLLGAMN